MGQPTQDLAREKEGAPQTEAGRGPRTLSSSQAVGERVPGPPCPRPLSSVLTSPVDKGTRVSGDRKGFLFSPPSPR